MSLVAPTWSDYTCSNNLIILDITKFVLPFIVLKEITTIIKNWTIG